MDRTQWKSIGAVLACALVLVLANAAVHPATQHAGTGGPRSAGAEGSRAPESREASTRQQPERALIDAAFGKLPLAFEANQGQVQANVSFVSRSPGGGIFLNSRGATVVLG